MQKLWKSIKPFLAPALLCAALLIGQAVCCLCLPDRMGRLVDEGLRQEGLHPGAPEVVSLQGMTLLQVFMTEQDRELMDEVYLEIRPGSSEAERFGERYPLIKEQTACVLRSDLEESRLRKAGDCYSRAAHAFFLYLKSAGETGELDTIAGRYSLALGKNPGGGEFGENIKIPGREDESLPEGVLGSVPEGAIFGLPEDDMMMEAPEKTFGNSPAESGGEDVQAEDPASGTKVTFSLPQRLEDLELEQVYTLLPLLDHASEGNLKAARNAASEALAQGEQVGIALKKLFYREAGIDTGRLRADYLKAAALKILAVALLGIAFSLAVWRLLPQLAARVKQPGALVSAGLHALLPAPVIIVGSTVLALQRSPSLKPAAAAGLALGAAALALLFFLGLKRPESKVFRRLEGWAFSPAVERTAPFFLMGAMALMEALTALVLCIWGEGIVRSGLQAGDIISSLQYALESALGLLAVCTLVAMLPRVRRASHA